MRVLHVHSGNLYGGIERMLGTIARHQHEVPGVEHEFALFFEGRLAEELGAAGAAVHRLPAVRLRNPRQVAQARGSIEAFTKAREPNALLFHGSWPWVLALALARSVTKVFWIHNPIGDGLLDRISRRRTPDLVLANSRFTAESSRGVWPKREASVIYPPVDLATDLLSRFKSRDRLSLRRDEYIFLQVGRLEEWKGHLRLLRALALLPRERPWRLIVVGGAQRSSELAYREALEREVSSLGLVDRVDFVGQRDDVPCWMGAANVFCQLNETPEPFGIVFAEALGAGLPVVAVPTGGVPEVLGPYASYLSPTGSAAADAAVLGRLLAREAGEGEAIRRARRDHAMGLVDPPARLDDLARAIGALA